MKDRIVVATRGSALALWQAHHVAARLTATSPGLTVELLVIKTKGDKILDVPLVARIRRARGSSSRRRSRRRWIELRARRTSLSTSMKRWLLAELAERVDLALADGHGTGRRKARIRVTPWSAAATSIWPTWRAGRGSEPRRCAGSASCARSGPISRSCRSVATSTLACASSTPARWTRSCWPARASSGSATPIASPRSSIRRASSPRSGRACSASRPAPTTQAHAIVRGIRRALHDEASPRRALAPRSGPSSSEAWAVGAQTPLACHYDHRRERDHLRRRPRRRPGQARDLARAHGRHARRRGSGVANPRVTAAPVPSDRSIPAARPQDWYRWLAAAASRRDRGDRGRLRHDRPFSGRPSSANRSRPESSATRKSAAQRQEGHILFPTASCICASAGNNLRCAQIHSTRSICFNPSFGPLEWKAAIARGNSASGGRVRGRAFLQQFVIHHLVRAWSNATPASAEIAG